MKVWRDAASLILAARHAHKCNSASAIHNYNLLCLKRHQKSSVMPGMYVFPGGAVDPADSDLKWYKLFADFGFDNDSLASLIPKVAMRTQIFQSRQNELPKDISLRITAIRETFEECGILMCRRKKNKKDTFPNWAEYMPVPTNELKMWQNKVHNNSTEFLTLCKKLECYPDLWALHEWSNWLTPTSITEKRFDTIFYLAYMPSIPYAEYDASEIEDLKWETPENLLSSIKATLWPPPQFYEIANLSKSKSIDNLPDLVVERNTKGMQLYLPIHIHLKDGYVYVLPGDTMYPKEISISDRQVICKQDVTIDEFREMSPVRNRMEYTDTQVKLIINDNVYSKTKY